ncbi:hypothetical protein [Sinomonas atrocyanea]
MSEPLPTTDEPLEPWEESLQDFLRQCRTTLLVGLQVAESEQVRGAADLTAYSTDPVNGHIVRLRAHWTADTMGEPSHWLSIGETTAEAPCTLKDTAEMAPTAEDDRLGRDILTLHTMAHLATAILREMALRPHVPGLAEPGGQEWQEMTDTEVSDALAALNGIARIYLGGAPADEDS